MGTTASTPEQEDERRQRQLMERMGVLIPPSFGVASDGKLPPSTLAMRRPSPSLLYSLERNSTCVRLLHEHMTPGLWVSASTPSQANVLAAFYVNSNEGMLSASQQFGRNLGNASIRAYTSEASLVSGTYSPTSYFNAVGNVDAKGMAWLGCNVNPTEWWRMRETNKPPQQQYYRNDPFAKEQQDVSIENGHMIQNLQLGTTVKVHQAFSNNKPSKVHSVLGFASMEIAGCTVAMETQVPLETLDPQVSYHVSANLNTEEGPPLIVTMQNSPTKSSLSLAQVLTFDRIVVNALETRCPRIRNTFGWAVQMEKKRDTDSAELMAGLAWQLNRGVGVKVVAKTSGVTAALLLKRWKQPRVLCSLLAGMNAPNKNVQFGIGLELETGPHSQDYYNETEERRVDDNVPATKPTLPEIGVTVNGN